MKKIILIFVLALTFIACQKNGKLSAQQDTYCIYSYSNGVKTFRGCAQSEDEMRSKVIALRNQNIQDVRTEKKNSCSDCQ